MATIHWQSRLSFVHLPEIKFFFGRLIICLAMFKAITVPYPWTDGLSGEAKAAPTRNPEPRRILYKVLQILKAMRTRKL